MAEPLNCHVCSSLKVFLVDDFNQRSRGIVTPAEAGRKYFNYNKFPAIKSLFVFHKSKVSTENLSMIFLRVGNLNKIRIKTRNLWFIKRMFAVVCRWNHLRAGE